MNSAAEMGAESLRDVSMEQVDRFRDNLDDVTYRRVRHVVTEITRLIKSLINSELKLIFVYFQNLGCSSGAGEW